MPTPTVSAEIGPLIGPWSVEAAATASLAKWILTYTQEVERQNSLMPNTLPTVHVYGAADELDFDQERLPGILVICTKPDGAPERFQSAGYIQPYTLTAAVVVLNDTEDTARQQAGLYAAAMMGVISQQFASDNPGLVSNVRMAESPTVELQDVDERTVYTGQASFRVWVSPTATDMVGPAVPVPDQGVVPTPVTVVTETVTVSSEPL